MNTSRSLLALLALALVAGASAAVEWNSTTVPISGTVTGRPESVSFSGRVQIQRRLAHDPAAAGRGVPEPHRASRRLKGPSHEYEP